MSERLQQRRPEMAQGKKENVVFKREWVGAGAEVTGAVVAIWQLVKLNPIGVAAGLGLWIGGRWIRYGGKKE